MAACTIHLVRHGAHTLPDGRLAGRLPGVVLSRMGQAQAASVARQLAAAGLRAVLTSPQPRTTQTAEVIAAACQAPLAAEPGLDEIDFGIWQSRRFDELEGESGWRQWNAARGLAYTPAGDSMAAAGARALAALGRAAAEGGVVAAVSHCDVIRAVLCMVLGMPFDHWHRLEIGLASRSVLVVDGGGARVEGINLPA